MSMSNVTFYNESIIFYKQNVTTLSHRIIIKEYFLHALQVRTLLLCMQLPNHIQPLLACLQDLVHSQVDMRPCLSETECCTQVQHLVQTDRQADRQTEEQFCTLKFFNLLTAISSVHTCMFIHHWNDITIWIVHTFGTSMLGAIFDDFGLPISWSGCFEVFFILLTVLYTQSNTSGAKTQTGKQT